MRFFWFLCLLIASDCAFAADISWENDEKKTLIVKGKVLDDDWPKIRAKVGGKLLIDEDLILFLQAEKMVIKFIGCGQVLKAPDWVHQGFDVKIF